MLVVAFVLALVPLVLLFPVGLAPAAVLVAVGVFLYRFLRRWRRAVTASELLGEEPDARVHRSAAWRPDFVVTEPGSGFVPKSGGTDSVEAGRFKEAIRDTFEGRQVE